jgi:hypothetical protein
LPGSPLWQTKSLLNSAAQFGYTEVDVDETKLDLYGPGIDDEQLTQDKWDLIYREQMTEC